MSAAVALLWATAPLPGAAEERLEVYRPRSRPATELAPIVGKLLDPAGIAIPDPGTGHLILRGDSASIDRALEVLGEIDVPLRTYRIDSTMTTLRELRRQGIQIEGWALAGEFRVGRLRPGPDGLRIRVRSVLSEGENRFEGRVTTLEGYAAEIWTGTTYPERTRTLHERSGQLRVYETTTLVPVRTGFRVRPRDLGDGRVDLEIAAVSSEEQREGTVVRSSVSTHLQVSAEELVVIALLRGSEQTLSIDPFAHLDWSDRTHDSVLLVRVTATSSPTTPPEARRRRAVRAERGYAAR